MSGEQLQPGTLLNDRYRILRVVGKGGMGTVYEAEHVRLETILAVKEVRAPQSSDSDMQALLEQCQHEARFLVRLHHPNLPQVTDAFVEGDRFYVVMEFIEGVTLEARKRMADGVGLPVAEVIEWGLQIADVLAYLHSQDPPIIFRDLKPSNVMLQADGRIRLIDFGIARRFQPGATKDTNLLGSIGYSPPEQFGRHQTDTRTDIYAFGATLHNLLTGNEPSHSPFKFAAARSLNPAVPEALSRLIDRCVRMDADARPQSIHEVAMELLAVRDTLPNTLTAEVAPIGMTPQPQELATEIPSTGARIILTNPTYRNTGNVQRVPKPNGSRGLAPQGSGSQDLPGSASGQTVSARMSSSDLPPETQGSRLSRGLWIGTIASIALVGGVIGVVALLPHSRPVKAVSQPPSQSAPAAVIPTPPAHAPNSEDTQSAPPSNPVTGATPSDSGTAPITGINRAVTFDQPVLKEVATDAQGHSVLRINVTGAAEGQPGDQEIIAAFFYDGQSTPMVSAMPQTPYSSKDGKLSVATTLTLASSSQPFSLTLDMPLAAFPTTIVGGAQFHCVAFYQDQRIGESKTYITVPPAMLSGTATDNSGAPPSTPNSGAPDNLTPHERTLRTRRGGGSD